MDKEVTETLKLNIALAEHLIKKYKKELEDNRRNDMSKVKNIICSSCGRRHYILSVCGCKPKYIEYGMDRQEFIWFHGKIIRYGTAEKNAEKNLFNEDNF